MCGLHESGAVGMWCGDHFRDLKGLHDQLSHAGEMNVSQLSGLSSFPASNFNALAARRYFPFGTVAPEDRVPLNTCVRKATRLVLLGRPLVMGCPYALPKI